MTEVYNSTTHGPIPLSFTARKLMANLRQAIMDAVARGSYSDYRNDVAFARGELAKYISQLESRGRFPIKPLTVEERLAALEAKLL